MTFHDLFFSIVWVLRSFQSFILGLRHFCDPLSLVFVSVLGLSDHGKPVPGTLDLDQPSTGTSLKHKDLV